MNVLIFFFFCRVQGSPELVVEDSLDDENSILVPFACEKFIQQSPDEPAAQDVVSGK